MMEKKQEKKSKTDDKITMSDIASDLLAALISIGLIYGAWVLFTRYTDYKRWVVVGIMFFLVMIELEWIRLLITHIKMYLFGTDYRDYR